MSNHILKYAKYPAIVLMLAGSFFSCKDENHEPEKFRLSKVLYYAKTTTVNPTDGVEYAYDEEGNMVRESFYKYSPNAELFMYREFEYVGSQKTKMSIFREDQGTIKLSWYVDYSYANNRLVKEELREADDWLSSTTDYEYQDGNLIREYYLEVYYGDFDEAKYTYDHQNRLVQVEKNSSEKIDYKYTTHLYDNEDREKTITYYDANWDLLRTVEKSYNGRSQLPVKELHYDNNGIQTAQYQHFYDKLGHLVETRLNGNCPLFKRKYNGDLLMEEIVYTKPERGCVEDETMRYEYQKY